MQIALLIPLTLAFGFCAAAQGPTNVALSRHVGTYQAVLISFAGGAICSGILLIFFGDGDLSKLIGIEPWKLLGGVCCTYVVLGAAVCIPHLGAALAIMLCTLGQLAFSVVIDGFGLFESTVIAPTPMRIAGLVILAIGVVLIYLGNVKQEDASQQKGQPKKHAALYLLFSFSTGIAAAINQPASAGLRATVGLQEYEFVHFCVGTIMTLILCLIVLRGKFKSLRHIAPWKFTGGVYGTIGMFLLAATVPVLGSTLFAAGNTVGQMLGGLAVDNWGFFQSRKIKTNSWRVLGIIVLLIGTLVTAVARAA